MYQTRNQLGTPGVAKSFLRGAQLFKNMSNSFQLCPTDFSRGGTNFCIGAKRPVVTVLVCTDGAPAMLGAKMVF